MSLQCSKVSILLLVKDRHWLIQLSHATLHKMQSGVVLSEQGDAANVYATMPFLHCIFVTLWLGTRVINTTASPNWPSAAAKAWSCTT